MRLPVPASTRRIAEAIRDAGGRALLVGGYVRDALLEVPAISKDHDIEVFGLDLPDLERVLARFGEVATIGRAFGVLHVHGIGIDFSLPRSDSKIGSGHRGFEVRVDPGLDFAAAARRRDLTINSLGFDPLTGELLDPHGGARDLAARRLRATDAERFGEDPLRGLRVAQFAARFEMEPDEELLRLCAALDLSELSAERVFEELRKLLLRGRRPSVGLRILERTHLLRFFPELHAMLGVPQDPEWHPEGDVWVHTCMVIDEAAALRTGGDDDLALMFAALCHDVGKPSTTVREDGRVRSPGHSEAGVPLTEAFLERLRAPKALTATVCALVRHHLAPALYIQDGAGPKAYRRLARRLHEADTTIALLERTARADHFGRSTPEALARVFPAGDAFIAQAGQLEVHERAPHDVVLGRHLIARGMQPGVQFGEILRECRDVQDETGWSDPEQILARVLGSCVP